MPQRVLIVDDDREIARLLRAYLEQSGYEVLVAYDGETALHAIRRDRPDLVVLDLMLPDRDGWEITRIVRGTTALAATPILMLTARVEDTDKIVGLELGADDYVTKPFNPQVVVARVRAILRRSAGGVESRQVLRARDLTLDLDRHEATVSGQRVELTSSEFEFLRALMQSPDHAFTRAELIERALGYEYEGLERTVDSHIKNLRQKIEPDPRKPSYIRTVYGVGYRLQGEG
jgi:two-component system alkaline phosphatase synthesis response regulator PhoP